MDIEYAFLADEAKHESGKLSASGIGFDRIFAYGFPVVHEHMALVVKFRIARMEMDREHRLEIALWDPDGQPIGESLHQTFSARANSFEPGRPAFVQIVLNIEQTRFDSDGPHSIRVMVDDLELAVVQFLVSPMPHDHEGLENLSFAPVE